MEIIEGIPVPREKGTKKQKKALGRQKIGRKQGETARTKPNK